MHFNLYETDIKISMIENGCPTADFEDFIFFAGQENDDKNFKSVILRKGYTTRDYSRSCSRVNYFK